MNKWVDIVKRNRADIFMTVGIGSILFGGVLAIKNTPKACKVLEDYEDSSKIEKVKKVAPLYVPSLLLTAAGISQIVYSRNINKNKLAAVTTAYTTSELAYKTFRNKVKENLEPERYEAIQKEYVKETVNRRSNADKENIIISGNKAMIYDSTADRYFEGTLNEIEKAVNSLNRRMRSDMTITLNDFYSEIGLNNTTTGDLLGWHIDKNEIEIYTSSGIADDGRPYIILELLGIISI